MGAVISGESLLRHAGTCRPVNQSSPPFRCRRVPSRHGPATCRSPRRPPASSSVGVWPTSAMVTSSASSSAATMRSAVAARQDVRTRAADDQRRHFLQMVERAPHVRPRLVAGDAEGLGDLHVVIEHDPARAVEAIEALRHRQPVLDLIARIDVGIALRDRARGMHPGRPGVRLADIGADPPQPRRVELGPDIVEQHAREPLARRGGEQHRDDPAQRGAERDIGGHAQLAEQRLDILDIGQRDIGHRILGVAALATAAQIDGDDPPLARQPLRRRR